MTDTLALERLYFAVRDRFVDEGTAAALVLGWRTPPQHKTSAARIAWVPGDPSGKAGRVGSAKQPGRNPRPLATLFELFTCEISAFDPLAPEDELAQYKAARLLYDAWYRAVYLAAHGTFTVESTEWLETKNERRHGAALRVVCSVQAMIPDAPLLNVAASARITLRELDVGEVYVFDPTGALVVADGGAQLVTDDTPPATIVYTESRGDTVKLSDLGRPLARAVEPYLEMFVADETLSALRVVRISSAGHVVYARPPELEATMPLGVTNTAAERGAEVAVCTADEQIFDAGWNWTPGLPVLLGPDGMLTQTQPPSQLYLVPIGVAVNAHTLVVRIGAAIFVA